jgi:hypothetical protein
VSHNRMKSSLARTVEELSVLHYEKVLFYMKMC